MATKQEPPQSGKLPAINRQILEIKRKIQLSEGRRKALFEETESEEKLNANEILRLKKETRDLAIRLRDNRSLSAKNRIGGARLEEVMGHLGEKTCPEVHCSLDLQVTDRTKHLDLIRYQIRKKEEILKKLADEYQSLKLKKFENYTKIKLEAPIKKQKKELENSIHAVQVQWREAEHVRTRYKEIRKSLLQDSAKFEANIAKTKQQLQLQQIEINRLEEVNAQANKMRAIARNNLQKEEKDALKAAKEREKQAVDGKRLIMERKQELEKLEKKIFQSGKMQTLRPETDGEDSNFMQTPTPPILDPLEEFRDDFETLKEATGGTTIDDVLERFLAQKDTSIRLNSLRKSGEENKRKLEVKQDNLNAQLESLQFAEVKDAEENAEELEMIQKQNEQQKRKIETYKQSQHESNRILENIFDNIQSIFINVAPEITGKNNPLDLVKQLKNELEIIVNKRGYEEDEKEPENVIPEKWLPQTYSSLMRRTPLPQSGAGSPAPPPGSDEEEEVPSRGYMKRQAQIVVDAKSRRKNIRFPTKK
nr:coiled-coil domain-containing protein 151 [Onthophagus taurus]